MSTWNTDLLRRLRCSGSVQKVNTQRNLFPCILNRCSCIGLLILCLLEQFLTTNLISADWVLERSLRNHPYLISIWKGWNCYCPTMFFLFIFFWPIYFPILTYGIFSRSFYNVYADFLKSCRTFWLPSIFLC